MDVEGRIEATDEQGTSTQGEGKVVLSTDAIELRPKGAVPLTISLRDVRSIANERYAMDITMTDGTRVKLSMLGHRYEDFVRELHRSRNELIMRDLLMEERLRKQGVKGELRPFRGAEGPCEVRLYDTAMVVMPLRHPLIRIRYADMEGIEARDFTLRVALDTGEMLTLTMLGRELDPLWKGVSEAMAELETATQALVRDAFPGVDTSTLSKASRLLRDGRAAARWDVENVSSELWKGLERKLEAMGLGAEYRHLASLGRPEGARIGIKRSLSSEEGEYLWFMLPLLGENGNAVAMEASSGPSTGRATYFFRIAPRSKYQSMDREERIEASERCMSVLTAGLREINFRRQPIYLDDSKLLEPQFSKYRFSVILIPELRELRSRFIGRVAHTSEEEWTSKVNELLAFNTRAKDDGARWSPGSDYDELED